MDVGNLYGRRQFIWTSAIYDEIFIFGFHFISTHIFRKLMNFEENLGNNEKELFPILHQMNIPRVVGDRLAIA